MIDPARSASRAALPKDLQNRLGNFRLAALQLAGQSLQIEHHRGQRLVELVGDCRPHLVHRIDPRHLHQLGLELIEPLLDRLALTQIADDADELRALRRLGFAHRQLDREHRAVGVAGPHLAPDADDPLLAGPQIVADRRVVFGGELRRHQDRDVLTDHRRRGKSEQRFAGLVERQHTGSIVDDDDAVHRGVEHGGETRL